ncbi:hypothetical protein BGZ81_003153, partial [Podila clonocystis]
MSEGEYSQVLDPLGKEDMSQPLDSQEENIFTIQPGQKAMTQTDMDEVMGSVSDVDLPKMGSGHDVPMPGGINIGNPGANLSTNPTANLSTNPGNTNSGGGPSLTRGKR